MIELHPPKIAIWFHTRISGGCNVDSGASIELGWGRRLFQKQIQACVDAQLYQNCNEFHIGVNSVDADFANEFSPDGVQIHKHGDVPSLLPTVSALQRWLPGHEDWLVLFFHSKGATHPNEKLANRWRDCMTHNLIFRWRRCVTDLSSGNYDAVGCHWTKNSPDDQNAHDWGANSYFAGVFWWATAAYLLTLPKLPERPHNRHQWFKPELLLGCGKPRILDYHEGSVMVHA